MTNKVDLFYVQSLNGKVTYKGKWLATELLYNSALISLRNSYLDVVSFLGNKRVIPDQHACDIVYEALPNIDCQWLCVTDGCVSKRVRNLKIIRKVCEEQCSTPLAVVVPDIANELITLGRVSSFICVTVPIIVQDSDFAIDFAPITTEKSLTLGDDVYALIDVLTNCIYANGITVSTYKYK